jgi:tRNA (adenine37-N6)-methyltransferase
MPVVHGAVPVPSLNRPIGGHPASHRGRLIPVARQARPGRDGRFTIAPIGIVRSACRNRAHMPGEGVVARIEILPGHRMEAVGVEHTSHLIVIGWLPDAGRRSRNVLPIKSAGMPARGVFATRSPRRPNPLSLTVVRVLERVGSTLHVDGLDLVDGTLVADLKPYMPGQDAIFSATRAWRTRTLLHRERLAGYLLPELRNHLGDAADTPAAMATMRAVLIATDRLEVDPRDPTLRAWVNRADASTDALMGLLGAAFASGRLVIQPDAGPPRIQFRVGTRTLGLRYALEDWHASVPGVEWHDDGEGTGRRGWAPAVDGAGEPPGTGAPAGIS